MTFKDIAAFLRRALGMVLIASVMLLQSGGVNGVARAESFEEYQIIVGDIFVLPTNGLTRISITDPGVADVSDVKPEEITLMGKEPGQTILFMWEEKGKRSVIIRVVAQDLAVLEARVQSLLASAAISTVQINKNKSEGQLVLTGQIPEEKASAFDKIIEGFSDQLIDLTNTEESKDLVQVDMQITELKKTLSKILGVDWFSSSGQGDQKSDTSWGVAEQLPFGGAPNKDQMGIKDIFRIGHFYRTSRLLAQIDALVTKGQGTILSKPRIVVKSGKEATFMVGGEIPIKTVTGTAGATTTITENIEYKEYGVTLSVTPTITEGKVDILLSAEISDLDMSAPTSIAKNGTAFVTRAAQTELLLEDRQTIVLAGLIRKDRSQFDKRVPFLGSVPILGILFRATGSTTPDADTEVVISLTTTILHGENDQLEKAPVATAKVTVPRSVEPPVEEDVVPTEAVTSRDTIGIPPITKNVGTVPVSVPQDVAPYIQMVQEKLSSAIAFPYEAQQNSWQGTVKLALVIKKDGSLRDVYIKESSGYEVFDQDAINTAQILAPYAPFSDSIKEEELSLTIPIVYSQDSFLKNVAKRN